MYIYMYFFIICILMFRFFSWYYIQKYLCFYVNTLLSYISRISNKTLKLCSSLIITTHISVIFYDIFSNIEFSINSFELRQTSLLYIQ